MRQLDEITVTTTIASFPASNSTELYPSIGRKYMKTEWIPGEDITLRLRYMKAPPPLVADSSTPGLWPVAFHDLLVYGAAIDIGLSQSTPSGKIDRWQKRYDDLMKGFMSAQINVPDARTRRLSRVIGGDGQRLWLTTSAVTSNFSG